MSLPSRSPDAGRRGQLNTLIGTRFLFAMLVFANHSGLETVFTSSTVNFLITGLTISIGEGALSYFFMLSGFVLTWSARPGDRPGRFWRRRAAKVLPNYLVTWTAGLVLMLIAGEAVPGLRVLPSLFLIQPWFPNVPVVQGTDGPGWSLACEALMYLAFPLLVVLIGRIREDRLWRWAVGLFAAVYAMPLLALLLPAQPSLYGLVSFPRFWFIVFLPPVRLLDFAVGIVVARLVLAGRFPRLRFRTVLLLILAGWAAGLAIPVPFGFIAPFIVPMALLLGAGAGADLAGRDTVMNRPLWVRLGELSFAFYLIHWLVLHYLHVAVGGGSWSAPIALAFLLSAFALALTASWLLYRFVELPLYRRFSRPRPVVVPSNATAAGVRVQEG